ncbi:MAG: T9SS type A sorting domain-containing protein [Flavobacteriales bacterium]|nr:T9SS type A sorting domain-containing protein [Flavobacteriales bacterium]
MKNLITLSLAIFLTTVLTAQGSTLAKIAVVQDEGNWINMLPDTRITPDEFFNQFLDDLGLDGNYDFELVDLSEDELGYFHYRYQETFKGYPVEGAGFILHVKDGFVSHGNGEIVRGIQSGGQLLLEYEEGLAIAKNYTEASQFYWENPEMEELIKRIKKDENATFFPQAKLVYADSDFGQDGKKYELTWKYELYTSQPDGRETVFVDASTGNVLFALEGCHHGSVEGTAETRYSGVQSIIADSISATEYRLIDSTRGGGIETYDMNQQVDDYSLAVDFFDDDNYWNNANAELNDAATDAHWGAEMFYDYFLLELGRDSYDNNGSPVINYVHYDENYFNAFWNGLYATYGDGSGNPLTSIDVVAHEFTHGVTEYTAGLIYQNESGALNESFSDIFGTAVENYGMGQDANWIMGVENFALRDISNPNAFGDPDTYQGVSWYNGAGDNGGVHINSGVQNFWFYLLSNGGVGTNDNGDDYDVDSIGMSKAAAIAYRNLSTYLMPGSGYSDARQGSIQAAEDLYGSCSDEVLAVASAWYAVGIGSADITPDLQVVEVLSPLNSSCDLGTEEQISMAFRLNPSGCGLTLEAGDEIQVSYQVNSEDPIVETIVLTEIISDGDILTHDFQTPADLSEPDQYFIDYTVIYSEDLTPLNDEISNHKLTNPLILQGGSILEFDNFNAKDSIYVVEGANAEAKISSSAANTGSKGFLMHSYGASVNNVSVLASEEGNFSSNPDFRSRVCSCVDLSGWEEAYLNFDLRQTYSEIYADDLGLDIDFMIALRVLVDDQQVGEQFHPTSNYDDPYLTHVMEMNEFAGTSFTLCFESVNFINEEEDDGNEGDKTTLDNIYFSQSGPTGLTYEEYVEVNLFPNPTDDMVNIEVNRSGIYDIEIADLLGNIVKRERLIINNTGNLDISSLAIGSYVMVIRNDEGMVIKKIQVE